MADMEAIWTAPPQWAVALGAKIDRLAEMIAVLNREGLEDVELPMDADSHLHPAGVWLHYVKEGPQG